jgi:hypothetical protein
MEASHSRTASDPRRQARRRAPQGAREGDKVSRFVQPRGDIRELSSESLPACLIQPMARELLDAPAGTLAEFSTLKVATSRPDDRVTLGQKALVGQVVERRKQLTARQIARRAKHNQGLGWRRCKCHSAPCPLARRDGINFEVILACTATSHIRTAPGYPLPPTTHALESAETRLQAARYSAPLVSEPFQGGRNP